MALNSDLFLEISIDQFHMAINVILNHIDKTPFSLVCTLWEIYKEFIPSRIIIF